MIKKIDMETDIERPSETSTLTEFILKIINKVVMW